MAASTAHALKDAVRFWWIRNDERAGLVLVILVLAAILALFRPVGHPIPLTGVVTAINFQGGKHEPAFNAWVDLGATQTVVGLPAEHGCVAGSRIALEKTRFSFAAHYFGEHYDISGHGCDVAPAAKPVNIKSEGAQPLASAAPAAPSVDRRQP